MTLASYPGSWGEGGERAWYTLFAIVLNYPDFPGIRILSMHIRVQ